jgi:cytosine/adenosine deaminase-related metal-dependent hydrolase
VALLVIKTEWTVLYIAGRHVPVRDVSLVIENKRIAAITTSPPADAQTIELKGGISLPGFINLHNHTINAPLFRGIVDDLPRSAIGESKVYSMLMPIGGLAVSYLEPDELESLVALGLLEIIKSGTTTLLDQFRPVQACILELAKRWGLRLYGAPYLFSPPAAVSDATVARAAQGSFEGDSGIATFNQLFSQYDQGAQGGTRVILGPHAADSCAPELLKSVNQIALERELLVTIHLAQSQGEVDRVKAERGMGTIDYMDSVGLLREGVIFAHGVHLTDDELQRVAQSGASLAHCPTVFLRGGKSPHYAHFSRQGLKVGIGTDAERMDIFAQMRASGFASKQSTGASQGATAAELLHAATVHGANALRRPDLGRLEVGAAADLIIIDANKAHLQPINDPIRTLVWYTSGSDIDTVMIDGQVIVRKGKALGLDESLIIRQGAAAAQKVWDEARRRGHFPIEAEPLREQHGY